MLGTRPSSRQRTARSASLRRALAGRPAARWSGAVLLAVLAVVLRLRPAVRRARVRLLLRAGPGGGAGRRRRRARPGGACAGGAGRDARRRWCALGWAAVGTAAALLVLPLLLSVANALRVRNCSFAAGLRLLRAAAAGDASLYAAPAGVLAGAGGAPAPRARCSRSRSRSLSIALVAAAPLPRSARVRLRSVRRLLPGADLRRGAAPAAHPAALPAGEPGLDRRPRSRSAAAAVGRGLEPAALARRPLGARPCRWWLASIVLYGMGGTLAVPRSRAPISRARSIAAMTTEHFVLHYAQAGEDAAPTWR